VNQKGREVYIVSGIFIGNSNGDAIHFTNGGAVYTIGALSIGDSNDGALYITSGGAAYTIGGFSSGTVPVSQFISQMVVQLTQLNVFPSEAVMVAQFISHTLHTHRHKQVGCELSNCANSCCTITQMIDVRVLRPQWQGEDTCTHC
jgi:hypothetical protein